MTGTTTGVSRAELDRYYRTAAIVTAGVGGALIFYAAIAEGLRLGTGLRPALEGAFSPDALRAGLYALAFGTLAAARLAALSLARKKSEAGTPQELAMALTHRSVVLTALFEAPGVLGFVGYLAAGLYPDMYALLALSLIMVIRNFPKRAAWEEEFRTRFGILPEEARR